MGGIHEGGGYGMGQLQLAGHCKKCKVMKMVELDTTILHNINYSSNKGDLTKQLNESLCERCHEEEFGLQAQRDKKLEALFASKKKWWEFWKD